MDPRLRGDDVFKWVALFLFSLFFALPASALETPTYKGDLARARIVTSQEGIAPGGQLQVALELTLPPHWHVYTDPPGDAGLAVRLEWPQLPPGVTAGNIEWPPATAFKEGDLTTYGYSDHVILPVRLSASSALKSGETLSLTARASWLICKDICIPEQTEFTFSMPVTANPPASAQAALFTAKAAPVQSAAVSLPYILLLALAGGLILNLMPCVFPVLSLKALSLAKHYHGRQARAHALAYTLGVLASFALLAGLLLLLAHGGKAIGWGYQMQSPPFVTFLAMLLFLIGLNLSGAFELPVLMGRAAMHTAHENFTGSFASGVLAVLVATPCTAPFMATAVAYALSQQPLMSLLVFEALGLGLALPFLLIGFIPSLSRLLPKPGAWMKPFREVLAFPMYLTAVWLLWVLAQQAGAGALAIALIGMVALAFTVWAARCFPPFSHAAMIVGAALGLLAFTGAAYGVAQLALAPRAEGSQTYSAAALERLRAEGRPVFIDATAAWCLTCKVNERVTLQNSRVREAFQRHNILLMVADWTNADPEVTALLEKFGHRGVPMYVYFPPRGEPVVLPQLLTPERVLEVITSPSPAAPPPAR